MPTAIARPADERINWIRSIPFFLVHAACLLVFFTGVTVEALVLCLVLYVTRMFCVTAGYHRYFAHRSFKTNRVVQFLFALGGTTAAQKGPLWWAGHHRDHHRFSDTERDLHSPQKGFWWSHVGWILCDKNKPIEAETKIKDFNKYPELRWLDRHYLTPPILLAVACFFIAGWPGVVVGFLWSTVLLWHGTFTVNSLNHVFGRRRYVTNDTSRNSAILAIWTLGEGWHNNHHYYAASVRQGFFWWEYDISYYVLKVMSWVGLVHSLRVPPEHIKAGNRVKDGELDIGMFRAYWNKATAAVEAAAARWPKSDAATDAGDPAGESPAPALAAVAASPDDGEVSVGALERLQAKRAALEEQVRNTLQEAEALAQLSRDRQRRIGLAAATKG